MPRSTPMPRTRTRRSRRGARVAVVGVLAATIVAVATAAFIVARGHDNNSNGNTNGNPAVAAGSNCPLTGVPAPSGSTPAQPAVAVVIGNDPAARPQSGLGSADVVFEMVAEGGITRFLAVFQCQHVSDIGPVRSVRWVDLHMAEQLTHPILAFAGGIIPDRTLVASSRSVYDADLLTGRASSAGVRTTSRVPPENLYTSTASLRTLFHATAPPAPLFSFSSAVPAGASPAASATIPFSYAADVRWTWSSSASTWLRSYGTAPALTTGSAQVSATNVVIESVHAVPGQYNESGPNSLGVHSITVGSGPVVVLRNGAAVRGTWQRTSYREPTQFVGTNGQPIALAPGNTWVEIVPNTVRITVTP